MVKKNSALRLSLFASIISLLLALTLAMLLLGDYGMSMQNYLHTLIPPTLFGGLIFTLLFTPAIALGLPRQVAALSAGFLFSASYGMVLATVAAVLGCLITLILARKLFAKKVQGYYPLQLAKVSHFFSQNTFLKALIIRLLPAGSNFLTNVLAGTAGSPIKPYVLGSALGFMPQMTIFALMGAGLQVNGQQQLMISIALLVIALLLSSYLYRKTRHKLTLS
ncbi:VTT domain-containing protein [Colwellia sp. MB3u-70]|uniref:TVP38/TMEM64 family protein n=1 Tax=unclassified Colwellia TaxID=196834 RepID=UPI0015F5388F|nr:MULTISPECIES: VTT domain-containing protein [unclassified Colwellia]MBA6293227.1 VTT domain-containing protein [Colwellia sp. MB3u-8]MBA6307001.1 VTT domain-containing protein [Colwellia sp. MB3u-70]